jgi:hypothetical protein
MHSRYCSNVPFYDWPTLYDFASFDLNSAAYSCEIC